MSPYSPERCQSTIGPSTPRARTRMVPDRVADMAETREHTALVAVRMPAGPAWREAVESLWASGAALLPIDHRLPDLEVRALLERARPEMLFAGGRGAEP